MGHTSFHCFSMREFFYGLAVVLLLSACQPVQKVAQIQPLPTLPILYITATQPPSPTVTLTATPRWTLDKFQKTATAIWTKRTRDLTQTLTPSRTLRPLKTQTPSPAFSPTPTATLPIFRPASTEGLVGTPLPQESELINASNVTRLANVAQWARGKLVDLGFTPDGQTFIVGSPFGLALYQANDLAGGSRWMAFASPVNYDNFDIGANGLVKLNFDRYWDVGGYVTPDPVVYDLSTGQVVPEERFVYSDNSANTVSDMGNYQITTADGKKEFRSEVIQDDQMSMEHASEHTLRQVYDKQSDRLSMLTDQIPDITYDDRMGGPEGCDLKVFSPCGNALMPVAMVPYQARFSSSGQSLAVLYRAWDLFNSESFSVLRTYQSQGGQLLQVIGSFSRPVQDFAYIPGHEAIMVAYVDGTIQKWDIGKEQAVYFFRDFTGQIHNVAYSYDGKYLLVLRQNELEVQRSRDGVVIARYDATAFSVSPTENRVAVGHSDGKINIEDLDRLVSVTHLEGHTGPIYALAYSPDGLLLASSAEDCGLRVWDAQKGTFLHFLELTKVDPYGFGNSRIFIYNMKFVPGANQLAGFGSWATMVLWDSSSGATKFSVKSQPLEYYEGMMTIKPHFPESFAVDPPNSRFFIDDQAYNLQDGKVIGPYQPPQKLPNGCSEAGPVTKDGKIRFSRGYDRAEGRICVLDARDFSVLQTIQVASEGSPDGLVGWPVLSPNGRQLAVPLWGGQILVYQVGE
jgi:WD40 repeat protein